MKPQFLIDKFLPVARNKAHAIEIALIMVDINIKDIESEPFINSLNKLKIYEWKKLRTQLNSLLEKGQ